MKIQLEISKAFEASQEQGACVVWQGGARSWHGEDHGFDHCDRDSDRGDGHDGSTVRRRFMRL